MFQELEYKYKAQDIGLADFLKLMGKMPIVKSLEAASWDTYYTKGEDEFLRFRNGQTPELTKKVKIKDSNNWIRVECDLPLDPKRITEAVVSKFSTMEGYSENFKIYKICFIYWAAEVNYVYYIVFDKNMRETGRFIEVEVNKEILTPERDGVTILNTAAEALTELGLSPQNRMKKSLFELYKK